MSSPAPQIELFYADVCTLCHKAMDFFRERDLAFTAHELVYDEEADAFADNDAYRAMVKRIGEQDFVPQIFVNGTHIAGWRKLEPMIADGSFDRLLQK